MSDYGPVLAALGTSFLIAVIGTGVLCRVLAVRGIIDQPNARSSHQLARPRGGGIAIIAAIAAGTGVLVIGDHELPNGLGAIGLAALILALVSWVDDVRGLPALARLIPQIICVAAVLHYLPITGIAALSGLPDWARTLLLGLAWLWFINLYNFMDGIDGITGIETLVITTGIMTLSFVTDGLDTLQGPALVTTAAAAGFLIWNWAPARIFMGDVGSVPLGFIIGWLLLETAEAGYLLAALILPGYYLADATITLLSRLKRGEKIWQAHKQHAYQRAVQNGLSHGAVSIRIGAGGLVLIGLAVVSIHHPWPGGIAACLVVALLQCTLLRIKS
ncbi:MAG: glycosyltransferase family 4 protein [Rhodospirillales bacterium]